jgi:hypothetical protein
MNSSDLEAVVENFGAVLVNRDIGDATTCCVLAFPHVLGAPPAGDLRVIASAYQAKLASLAYVVDLPDFAVVILYCTLRTRAFLPPGVDTRWQLRNFKPCAGKGRALSDLVKRHARALDAGAARSTLTQVAAQSPQRCTDGAMRAVAASSSGARELQLRVAELEAAQRADEERVAAVEKRCRIAEASLLSLRAELQFVRATASAALAVAQKRVAGAEEVYPRM